VASLISHGVAAVGISALFLRPGVARRVWIAGTLCAMAPDVDVVGFAFGVRYGDFLGHRGFSHSLVFAALLASVVAFLLTRSDSVGIDAQLLWSYLLLATASHGFLDAMTDGGLGVAFFSPFDLTRYFLPWTPIRVSPIGISGFFSARGLQVLATEFVWIWIPTAVLAVSAWFLRRTAATTNREP